MSSAFPDWKRFAVRQRRATSGCIPTGYEMLLRAAGVEGIDLDSFQDEFDLDQQLGPGVQPRNNFESVADAVRKRYPCISFRRVGFAPGNGAEKLAFVEARVTAKQLVLVSLSLEPLSGMGWHIMPVVNASDDELILLNRMNSDGTAETWRLQKNEFVRIHNTYSGGDDVAYLEMRAVV